MKKTLSIDTYLAALDADKRAALKKLRRDVKAAAPAAEECISYGLPAFKLHGRMLAWFGAARNHCSFYPGAYPIAACKQDLKAFATSKGTIRFQPDHSLSSALVRRLVKARIAERLKARRGRG